MVGATAGDGVGAVSAGLGATVGQVVGVGERGSLWPVVVCGLGVDSLRCGVRVAGFGVFATGLCVEAVVATVAGGRTMR